MRFRHAVASRTLQEGSRASATSSQTELRLVNVARARLDEVAARLRGTFCQRRCPPLWAKDAPESRQVRDLGRQHAADRTDPTDPSDRPMIGRHNSLQNQL